MDVIQDDIIVMGSVIFFSGQRLGLHASVTAMPKSYH